MLDIFIDGKVTVRRRDGKTINLIPSYQGMTSGQQQKGIIVEGYKYSIKPFVKFALKKSDVVVGISQATVNAARIISGRKDIALIYLLRYILLSARSTG